MESASYYRARIVTIKKLLETLPESTEEKNNDRVLVRNGFIPNSVKYDYEKLLKEEYYLTFSLNEPLTFTETTRFNTWFDMYPEKICGKEFISTSREFPITVKGTKEDIEITINKAMEESVMDSEIETQESENKVDQKLERANRFGSSSDVLELTVSGFEGNYFDKYEQFQVLLNPLEEQFQAEKENLKAAGRDKLKRKEINEKLNEISGKLSQNNAEFEQDWMEYCSGLRELINEIALSKGLQHNQDNDWTYADDVMVAITERPGQEQYWRTKIKDVINIEMEYYIRQESQGIMKTDNSLELEALALEVELQLLKIK
ncbi:MAG: hypothetical protein NTW49_08735 [Bacteroidia bacterium]|nr:hypothetical protein [Bacteroidia bacterium]